MSREKNLMGKKFGRLTVIEKGTWKTGDPIRWICRCDCGTIKEVSGASLRRGEIVSCDCLKNEKARQRMFKHGHSNTLLYEIWKSMKGRCERKTCKDYPNYGGRGIKVYNDWQNDFVSFRNWAIANGYKEHLTIERINVNGNYEPDNCTWIPNEKQALNLRKTVKISYNGEMFNLREFAARYNMNYNTVRAYHNDGMSAEQIVERLA